MKRLGRWMRASAVIVGFAAGITTAPAVAAQNPLDPLSPDEIRAAAQLTKADPRLAGAAFPLITLAEPEKSDVLAWKPGRPIARRSRVVAMAGTSVFEVVVDLGAKRLSSVVERKGVEAPVTLTEAIDGVKVVLDNPEFQAGLKKRGVTDFRKVFCAPFSAGYYGIPEHEGKRLVKVGCFDLGKEHDVWVTPYDRAERYAGGDYMFASRATGGLPVWTERNRSIRNKDIVVWINLGMHHLTRAEDMPVMPMIWHSFKLRPHNFFDRNPAIDLRTEFAGR